MNDLLMPDFAKEANPTEARKEYDRAYFGRKVKGVRIQGMGVRLSDARFVNASLDERIPATLSFAAPGVVEYYALLEALGSAVVGQLSEKFRVQLIRALSQKNALQQMVDVHQRHPYGIVDANVMDALGDSKAMTDLIGASGLIRMEHIGAGIPARMGRQMAQYRQTRWAPIASSEPVATFLARMGMEQGCPPSEIVFEDPRDAGGHLGAKNPEEILANTDDVFTPERFLERTRASLRVLGLNIPISHAGGRMYREDIEASLAMGFDAVGLGLRGLYTQESKLPDELITKYHLDPRYPTVVDMTSAAGLPCCHVEIPDEEKDVVKLTAAEVLAQCVQCIGGRCLIRKSHSLDAGDGKELICLARELAAVCSGHAGHLFASRRRDEIMHDFIYRLNGAPNVPTLRQGMQLTFMDTRLRKALQAASAYHSSLVTYMDRFGQIFTAENIKRATRIVESGQAEKLADVLQRTYSLDAVSLEQELGSILSA